MEVTPAGGNGVRAAVHVAKVFRNETDCATIQPQQTAVAPAAAWALTQGNVRLVCVQVALPDVFIYPSFYFRQQASIHRPPAKLLYISLSGFLLTGEVPRKTRGSLIGMVNDREFGVSFLEANITDDKEQGSSTLEARLDNIPPAVGELLYILHCSIKAVVSASSLTFLCVCKEA